MAMPAVSRYIMQQIAGPFGFFSLALTGVIWLTQSLRLLDVIITKGQTALTYATFTGLVLPSVLTLTLPAALFCAVLYALNRLITDHELVVLSAAGQSVWTIVRPLMYLAVCIALCVYVISLWIMPLTKAIMKDEVMEIRADLAVIFLQEGAFSNPIQGLTVYIRERDAGGEMRGILVHDNRNLNNPTTYMAERGVLIKSGNDPRLIMLNGNVQRRSAADGSLSLLYFDRYVYDLSAFMPDRGVRWREPEERYLSELFFPDASAADRMHLDELRAEGHRRLTAPLYVITLAFVAMAALLSGPASRITQIWRIGAALAAILAVRLVGIGIENLVERQSWLIPGLYLWPMLALGGALLLLSDRGQRWILSLRLRNSRAHRLGTG